MTNAQRIAAKCLRSAWWLEHVARILKQATRPYSDPFRRLVLPSTIRFGIRLIPQTSHTYGRFGTKRIRFR
jgi:hypothetical protein